MVDYAFDVYYLCLTCKLAFVQISTYSFSFPSSEDAYNTYLVPVIDLINHAPQRKANVAIQMEDDGFVAKATKDIKKGDEVIVFQSKADNCVHKERLY